MHRNRSRADLTSNAKPRSPTVLLLLIPLFLGLGVWQLQRADEKAAWRATIAANQEAPPLTLSATNSPVQLRQSVLTGRRTTAWGHYLTDHQYLLDNQAHGSRSGYWVLTPFMLDNQRAVVLVNRGWIASGSDRSQVPEVKVSSERLQIEGRLVRPYRPGLVLPGSIPEALSPSLARIQYVDTTKFSRDLPGELLPAVIELAPHSPLGFDRQWQPPTINAERHIAYALQWFAFAGIVLIIFCKSRSAY